jgi:hypothetical protein
MKLTFNVTGQERKTLAGAISTALNAPAKYLGAPTFAYEVGGYRIDKAGTVTGEDNRALVEGLEGSCGFVPEAEEYESMGNCGSEAQEGECGGPRYTGEEFGLGARRTDPMGEDGMQESDCSGPGEMGEAEAYAEREMRRLALEDENVPGCSNRGPYGGNECIPECEGLGADTLTVEYPLGGMGPEALENLRKMVAAKEALIKAALGAGELPIQQADEDGGKLRFPWFTLSGPSEAACYAQFVRALCEAAKGKKRVTAKEREVGGNPKYAMRCWLLSLGLIGGEYKDARKLLLARLPGNGSFKGGSRPTYTVHCYTYPNGSEEDAMDCETTEFASLAKAKAFCDEFARDCEGIKYAGAHVEDGDGQYVYELLLD